MARLSAAFVIFWRSDGNGEEQWLAHAAGRIRRGFLECVEFLDRAVRSDGNSYRDPGETESRSHL